MRNEEELTKIVAKNIAHYRKLNNMTQLDLAEKISYSDKAISKWERGESLPDVYILTLFSEIFNVSVNDLLEEKSIEEIEIQSKKAKKSFLYNKVVVALLSSGLVLFVAVVLFALLKILFPNEDRFWLLFVDALPIMSIIFIVFAKLYWKRYVRFIATTLLNWTLSIALYVSTIVFVDIPYLWLLFVISAAFQVLVIFWQLRKRKK